MELVERRGGDVPVVVSTLICLDGKLNQSEVVSEIFWFDEYVPKVIVRVRVRVWRYSYVHVLYARGR